MRLKAPETFEKVEVPTPSQDDLTEGEVILRLLTGGLCGSDTPKFRGIHDPDNPYIGDPGAPLHEIVGEVVASKAADLPVGTVTVGAAPHYNGLAEYTRTPAERVIPVDPALDPSDAIVIQPIATVLKALGHVPPAVNDEAVVLGLGPLGLFFCHILNSRGYRVTGVDRVDRSDVAEAFGISEVVCDDIERWTMTTGTVRAPGLVVDAVGHNQRVIECAVNLAAPRGHIELFGLPDDGYAFPVREFFRKDLSMHGGTTLDWRRSLAEAQDYVLRHRELYDVGITNRFHPFDAEAAFVCHARPRNGRLKVVLSPEIPMNGAPAAPR